MKRRLSQQIRNLALNALFLGFGLSFGLGFLVDRADAYVTRLDINFVDVNSTPKKTFTTIDPFVSVRLASYFCVEDQNPSGTYTFTLRITDPSGVVVKEVTTAAKATPSTSQMIEQNFGNIPLSFLTKLGSYRVYASFNEDYTTGKKLNFTNTGFFEIKDAGFSTTLFSSNLTLIQPANKAVVAMQRPFFQWAYNANVARYSIYVGETENPDNISVWKEEGIVTNFVQYPANAKQLEFGKKYYWVVKGLDQLGRPIGGNLGSSEVFSFFLGNGDGSNIVLIGPKDSLKVKSDQFYFSWEGLYGDHNYELVLASDANFENIVWTGNTSETSLMYPVSAAELLVGQKYYWRVKVIVSGFFNLAQSEVGDFIFDRSISDVIKPPQLGAGKSGVVGLVKGQFGNPLEAVYVSIEGPLSFGANAISYNVATDSLGRYSQELNAGTYRVKYFKSLFKEVVEEIKIESGKSLNKDVTLFDQGTILTGTVLNSVTGEGIAGVAVTLKNFFTEVKTITSESGTYSFTGLLPGSFVIETDYPPFFEPQNVEVVLKRGSNDQNIYLKGKPTGVIYGKVNKSSDGVVLDPIIQGKVMIKALELATNSSSENVGVSQAEVLIVAGKFEAIDLKPGLYEVLADTAQFALQKKTIQVQAGSVSNVDFVISTKKSEVKGRVLNDEGSPISNAHISIKDKPSMGSCTSDMFGSFTCLFYEGDLELLVSAISYELTTKKVTIKGSTNVGNVIVESEKGKMELSVKDSTGNAVVGAKIRLLNSNKSNSFPKTEPVSDSNGKFASIRLPYFSYYEIEVYHPTRTDFESEKATLWMQKEGSSETLLRHEFVLMKTVQLQGLVQSESMNPLTNATVTIPGTSYSAISGVDGRFSIKFPLLDPEPDSLTVNVSRAGFYPERRQVSPGVLSVPLVVRLIDEQKKIASFTNVMLNNTMLDIRTGLDDLINWVNWAVKRIEDELAATNALYLEYKASIDLILSEINAKKSLIEEELKKPFITIAGLQLSIQMRELNDRIKILVDAMRIKITKRLNDTEAFMKLVQATASVTIPEIQMKISDVKESISKSPFIDEVQRDVLMVSATVQETKFNTHVKTYYETKSREIEKTFNDIKKKILDEVKATEVSVAQGQKLVEDFLAHIKVISESGNSGSGSTGGGTTEIPSLTEIIKFFGVEFKLDYLRVAGNTGNLNVKGTLTLYAKEGTLPANLGFDKLEIPLVVNNIPTPFQNETLKVLIKFIKTEEFAGPVPSTKELQELYPKLNDTERGIFLGAGIATASAAATYIVQNRAQVFDKIMMIAATELANGIVVIPANESRVLANLGYYNLVMKGLSIKSSGSINSSRVELGALSLEKAANTGTTIALPQSLALESVSIGTDGKIDFSKAKAKLVSGDFSFSLPGLNAAVGFDSQTSLELTLNNLQLSLKNMALNGSNGQVRVTAVFGLKPFKVIDVQVGSQPISLANLADIKSMFNVDFKLNYVRGESGGKLSMKGTLTVKPTANSLPSALGFNGKDFPITLSNIPTPFQENTVKTLVKFIKTEEYMGAPPSEEELKTLYGQMNSTEKAVFIGAGITTASAAAVYIIQNREKLLEMILAKIAQNLYLVPDDKEEKLLAIGPYDLTVKGIYLSGNGTIASTKLNLNQAQLKLDSARYNGSVALPGVIALQDVNIGTDGKIDFSKAKASITSTNISLTIPGVNGSIGMDQNSSVELLLSSTLLKLKDFALTNLTTGQTVRANVDIQLNPFGFAKVEIGGQTLTSLADVAKMFGVSFTLDYIKTSGSNGHISLKGTFRLDPKPGSMPTALGFDGKDFPVTINNIPTPFQKSTLDVMLRFIKTKENDGVAPSQEELLALWPSLTAKEKAIFGGAATVAAGAGVAYVIANKDSLWDKLMAIVANDVTIVPANEEKVLTSIGPYDLVVSGLKLSNPGAGDIETLNIAQLISTTKFTMNSFGLKRNSSDIGPMQLPGLINLNNVTVTGNGLFDFSQATASIANLNASVTIPGLQYTIAMDSTTKVTVKLSDLTMDIIDLALTNQTTTTPLRATVKLQLKPFKVISINGQNLAGLSLADVTKMFGVSFELDYIKPGTNNNAIALKGTVTLTAKQGTLAEMLQFNAAIPVQINNIPTPFQTSTLAVVLRFIKTKENVAGSPSEQELLALWPNMNTTEKLIVGGSATVAAAAGVAYAIANKDSLWDKLMAMVANGVVLIPADKEQKLFEIGPYEFVAKDLKLENPGAGDIGTLNIGQLITSTKVSLGSAGLKLKSGYNGAIGLPQYIGISGISVDQNGVDFSNAVAQLQGNNISFGIPGQASIGMTTDSQAIFTFKDRLLDLKKFQATIAGSTVSVEATLRLGSPVELVKFEVGGIDPTNMSLADVANMFGIEWDLNYVKRGTNNKSIAVSGEVRLKAKEGTLAALLTAKLAEKDGYLLKKTITLNNLPTPFRNELLDLITPLIKTKENVVTQDKTPEFKTVWGTLNNAEKAFVISLGTLSAAAVTAMLTNNQAAELGDQAINSLYKDKSKVWAGLLSSIQGGIPLVGNEQVLLEVGPYNLVANDIKVEHNGNALPQDVSIAQIIPTAKALAESVKVSVGGLGFKLKSGQNAKLPNQIAISNVTMDVANGLDFSNASLAVVGTNLNLDIPPALSGGSIGLDGQSAITFSFNSLILEIKDIKITNANNTSNRLGFKFQLDPFKLLDITLDGASLSGGLAEISKMFNVEFELDYIKPGTQNKRISFAGDLKFSPKPGTLLANKGFAGRAIRIQKDNLPFILENSTTAVLVKYIKTKQYPGPAPKEQELLDLWPSLTSGEKAIFTGLGVAAAAGAAGYFATNKDKLLEMLLALVENDIELIGNTEQELYDKALGPYKLVAKNIVLKKQQGATITNIGSLIASMQLNVGNLGFRFVSGTNMGNLAAIPQYIGINGVSISTGGLDFSNATANVDMGTFSLGVGGYAGIGSDANTSIVYNFDNHTLDFKDFKVELFGVPNRLTVETELVPFKLKAIKLSPTTSGSSDPCAPGNIDPATGSPIINVNNPEQLQLALKISDIQNHANAIKAVLGDAVNHVNDVPNTMGPFYTLVMQINQNLEKAKNAIDLLDNKVGQLIDTFNVTKDFVGNFHKNFHINQIKGIDANLSLRTVEGEKLKFYLSGTVTIKETRDFPSFTIPIPDIKIDASKFLGTDAVGNFLTKMRDASTKMKDFLKEHLSALQNLVTDSGVSNLKSMIPSALLNFTGSFLPQEIKNTEQYTDQIPSSITNFSASSVFPEWLLTFNFCSIPEEEKELIKTQNAYEYVYSKLPTYLQSLIPSQELSLKNLNKDFLVKEFFPTAITDIVNAIKSGDANKITELVMSAMPEQLLPMAQATFNMLKNGMNNNTVSDFVKVFLDQALREYLPANFFTMVLDDISPAMLKNFKPNEFLAKMKENVKNILDPEFIIKKDGVPVNVTLGDLDKHPFDVTFTNIALGFDSSRDKAYLGADLIVKFGDKIKRTIKQMPDEARMNQIRIYEDASTSLTELIVSNLNVEILGFEAQIQKFIYNFAINKIGIEGRFKFKLLGEERLLSVQDFAIQKVSGKWEVAALNFQLSPPIKVSALELSSLSFDSPNKMLNFGGRLVSTDNRLREIQLGSIKFQDGRLLEASASFNNLEFNLYQKVKIGIEAVDVSIKDSIGNEPASFRVKMLNSSIKFGDFKDQENPNSDYSIAVGLIDVYWRNGEKLDFQFDDVNIQLKPFDFKAFVFHVKKFTINKVRDGGSMVTQMRIHVRVEIPIPGADNGGANSVESSWVFTEGQPVKLERLQLDLNIKGNRIKGILVNEPAYLYAAVDIQLAGGFRAYGEFFRQDRNNWRITANLTFPVAVTLFSVGAVSVGVKGGGLTVGERDGDLMLGLSVDIVVVAGPEANSGLMIFDGSVSITYFFGINLLRITGSGTLNLSEQVTLGPVYAEFNLQFAGADSYMTALVIANPTIAKMIEATAQMNMDVRRQYFTMAFAVGAQIKVLGIKVGLSAGMQFAIGLSQNAPMSPLIVYNGLLYTLPADIKGGIAFFIDGYASISTADFGIPSSIIDGSLTLQGGAAVTLDFAKGVFNGGAFAKVNGSVTLLSVVSVSVGLSVDMAAQIGKKSTYFVGQAAAHLSASLLGISYSQTVQFVVKFGQVPDELLTLANAPANFAPNPPKGALTILTRDPFGVPVGNADVVVTHATNTSIKSIGKTNNAGEYLSDRIQIYENYKVVVTDPNGKFVMDVICDNKGENCTQGSANVGFNFSGQTYIAKMMPTTPLMDLSVKVERPTDAQANSEVLKGMRVRVTDKNTNMDMDEVTQETAVDQLKVGSLTKYSGKNEAGYWANVTQIFIQPNSNTKFKVTVLPKAESEYDETTVDNVDFAQLAKVVDKQTNLQLNNSRHMKINLEFKKIILEGKVTTSTGDSVNEADVELYYNNALLQAVKTNAQGKYSIANLKPFDYELRVKKANFGNVTRNFKLTPLSKVQDFTLEASKSQIFVEAKDVSGGLLSGVQFVVGGGNDDNCTTDSSGKCELKKISVGKSYTMKLPPGDARIIAMQNVDVATYDESTRQVSFTTTSIVNRTISVTVQNGPKLFGKFVSNTNTALEVLPSEVKVFNETNSEITGLLKNFKADGSFEIFFGPVNAVTNIKVDVNKSGANRVIKNFTLEPMSQKAEQSMGNVVINSSPIKHALLGKVITTAGGYKLKISEDVSQIIDSTDSAQHFTGGDAQVLLVGGELFFENTADFKANGSIEFTNVKLEAKFASNGNDVDVHLVTTTLGGAQPNLASNQLPVNIFGVKGLIRDVEVDLKQNGVIKGKPSVTIHNEIGLFSCSAAMTFDSNEQIAKVDSSGNVTLTMPVGEEKVFKIRDSATCNAQGPQFEINATESLKVVFMGSSSAVKYKMKVNGYVLLPKINNQNGFSRLGGNNAIVSVLVDVTTNALSVSTTGQADIALTTNNVIAIAEGNKTTDHRMQKVRATPNGIVFEYAQVLPKDNNNPVAEWKNGSITFDAQFRPVIGPAAEPNSATEQVNINVNVDGQIKQYRIDKKDLKMYYNKATGQRFMGIEENKSTQQ